MTLISALVINECPIIFGDLLVSGQPSTNNLFTTPTRIPFNANSPKKKFFEPIGLCQKASILSPTLAIAWAGNKDEAVSFYSQVIGSGVHLNPTIKLLHEIYYDLDNPDELSLIGMFWCGAKIRSFWLRSDKLVINKPPIQNLVVAGSGKEEFLNILDHGKFEISSGSPNNLETAISFALTNISNLFMSEIATANTVQNYYGAGYEVIYPLGDHFEKFCDLTYIFWSVEIEKNTIVCNSTPYLAMKYSYCGDLLLIRSIHLSGNKLTNELPQKKWTAS